MTTTTTTPLQLVNEYITESECESSTLYNNICHIASDSNNYTFSHNFVHDTTQVQHWLEKYIPQLTKHPLWSIVSFDDHPILSQCYFHWQGVWADLEPHYLHQFQIKVYLPTILPAGTAWEMPPTTPPRRRSSYIPPPRRLTQDTTGHKVFVFHTNTPFFDESDWACLLSLASLQQEHSSKNYLYRTLQEWRKHRAQRAGWWHYLPENWERTVDIATLLQHPDRLGTPATNTTPFRLITEMVMEKIKSKHLDTLEHN